MGNVNFSIHRARHDPKDRGSYFKKSTSDTKASSLSRISLSRASTWTGISRASTRTGISNLQADPSIYSTKEPLQTKASYLTNNNNYTTKQTFCGSNATYKPYSCDCSATSSAFTARNIPYSSLCNRSNSSLRSSANSYCKSSSTYPNRYSRSTYSCDYNATSSAFTARNTPYRLLCNRSSSSLRSLANPYYKSSCTYPNRCSRSTDQQPPDPNNPKHTEPVFGKSTSTCPPTITQIPQLQTNSAFRSSADLHGKSSSTDPNRYSTSTDHQPTDSKHAEPVPGKSTSACPPTNIQHDNKPNVHVLTQIPQLQTNSAFRSSADLYGKSSSTDPNRYSLSTDHQPTDSKHTEPVPGKPTSASPPTSTLHDNPPDVHTQIPQIPPYSALRSSADSHGKSSGTDPNRKSRSTDQPPIDSKHTQPVNGTPTSTSPPTSTQHGNPPDVHVVTQIPQIPPYSALRSSADSHGKSSGIDPNRKSRSTDQPATDSKHAEPVPRKPTSASPPTGIQHGNPPDVHVLTQIPQIPTWDYPIPPILPTRHTHPPPKTLTATDMARQIRSEISTNEAHAPCPGPSKRNSCPSKSDSALHQSSGSTCPWNSPSSHE